MKPNSYLHQEQPEFHDGYMYLLMAGTSQASAVTSGVVALMLQFDPYLSADDVKCRLMASTRAAVGDNGGLAYALFRQGTGLIDADDAVYGLESGCANGSLNPADDLSGREHYGGPARKNKNGHYYVSIETM